MYICRPSLAKASPSGDQDGKQCITYITASTENNHFFQCANSGYYFKVSKARISPFKVVKNWKKERERETEERKKNRTLKCCLCAFECAIK